MFTKNSIDTYLTLNEEESTVLSEFVRIINEGTPEEKQIARRALKAYSPETIFKLGEKSALFREFCANSQEQLPSWIATLQETGYPGTDISPPDGDKKCTTLNQYVGIFLFRKYKKAKADNAGPALLNFLLEKACQHLILFALVERCKVHIDSLSQTHVRNETKEKNLEKIDADIQPLITIYQSLGYGHACQIHLRLGHYYSTLPPEDYGYLVTQHYRLAVAAFCCAEITATTEYSKSINHFVLGEKNYFEHVLGKYFKNWEKAKEDYILKFIDDDISLYNSLHRSADEALKNPGHKPVTLKNILHKSTAIALKP